MNQKQTIEVSILMIALIVLFIQPTKLKQIIDIDTVVGRILLLIIIFVAYIYNIYSCIIIVFLLFFISDYQYENFEEINNHSSSNFTMSNLKRGSVSDDLLESTADKEKLGLNIIDNTTIIGDTPGIPIGSASDSLSNDLTKNSSNAIIFSNAPSTKQFKKNNCRSIPGRSSKIFVNEKGKEMKMVDIKKKFPLNFTNGIECNPCDDNCSYTVTDSVEQLYNEDNLRSKQSSSMII